jgi:glycosyltransferase involved in cell wall biosynthesis
MKIIYLHQYFNTPAMKGGTRSYEMARRMVARGHEVHMITSRREGIEASAKDWLEESIDGINVHWLPVPYNNTMSYFQRIKAFLRFASKAGQRSVMIGGDLIFATSTPLTIAIPAVRAKKALNIPMVFEVRDLWPELPIAIGALKSPLVKFLAYRLERYAYFNADHIIALSPGMREGILKTDYPANQVTTIPNSCDLDIFDVARSQQEEFRAQRDWLEDKPLVLYAGTLGHINGVAWLAKLAAKTKALNSDVRFLVLGAGVDEKKVRERAMALGVFEQNFFMEAQISKAEMPKALQAADICTSLFVPLKEMWSNSANKFFDALASGRPVAINYSGWQKDLVEKHNIGIALPEDDIDKSAQELVKLLAQSKRRESMGNNALALAKKSFSRDVLAAQLIETLERVKNSVSTQQKR